MIKQVLVCKKGNRLFLLRYGFGYLTTIYKFATLQESDPWLSFQNSFFSIPTTRNASSVGLILFKIVFRLCLWSISLYQYEIRVYGQVRIVHVRMWFANEEECRCVIMAINIQLCDYDKDLVYSNTCTDMLHLGQFRISRIKGAKSVFICHRTSQHQTPSGR